MSMTVALNNAISGLGSVGRAAQVVSSNISNALTEGYGRREINLSSARSGGVRVDGVSRAVNPALVSERRNAGAALARQSVGTDYQARLDALMGAVDSPDSLSGRLTTLEGRLIEAATRPDSATRLRAVADGARALATEINQISQGIQGERLNADHAIDHTVETLNTNLQRIGGLNASISRLSAQGADINGLLDQRQLLIDAVSEIVPLREIQRDRNVVALMTTGGQVLLDSRAATFEFTPSNVVTPGMSLVGGQLSALSLDGRDIVFGTPTGRMEGGRLAGLFAVRDTIAPDGQTKLDELARDLISRFQDPAVDSTLGVGDAGLFTDGGAALTPAAPPGLAQRLSLNARADPDQGGDLWRLRDGLGAPTPGPEGNGRGLNALSDALSQRLASPVSGADLTFSGGVGDLVASVSGALFLSEQSQVFAQTRADTLRVQELAGGVNTDQEMQNLLLVEQAYGANAKVIQAVDAMLQRLMEI